MHTKCYTKHWAWKSYRRNGCRVCSQWNGKNGIAWQLQSTVWTCLSAIQKRFCVSSLLTKHGSTITHQKRKNSLNSGLNPANLFQRRQKRFQSAGKIMATVFWDSRGIIFTDYLEKRRTITGQYCVDLLDRFDAELKKTASFSEKKVLFHHNDTLFSFVRNRQNWSNCCLIHPILQIPLRFLFISKHEKNDLAESALHQMRKSSPKQRPILRSSTNHIF